MKKESELIKFLNNKVSLYNRSSFIKNDPVSIPHLFSKKQDIEIAGFFAAIFSWGNRTTIIKKSMELMKLMDMSPYDFCRNSDPNRLKNLSSFKHRTFNTTDLLYFIEFFKSHYSKHQSLEPAFSKWIKPADESIENALINFHHYFFSKENIPERTKKHIATPERNSSCKRINMFLRWMVRKDNQGVDFGIWKNISPSQLICPLDLHVSRVAKRLNILKRKQTDWRAAVELTAYLRTLDKKDPVKYDYALFGMGIMEKF